MCIRDSIYTLPSRIVGWFAGKAGYQRVQSDAHDEHDPFMDDDEDDFIPSPVGVNEDLVPQRAPRFSFSRKPVVAAIDDDDLDDAGDEPLATTERREPEFNLNPVKNTAARSEPTFTASWSALELSLIHI